MKRSVRWCLWALAILGWGHAASVDLRTARAGELPEGLKANLDLPFDAIGGSEEDEELPEVVVFYGTNLEGDGFFYVIDRSGSMMDSGELDTAKREVARNIAEFSEAIEFGVVFFDKAAVTFPTNGQPAEATPALKSAATTFVQTAQRGRGSCPQSGLSAGLKMANLSSARRKIVVYLGDGGGTCAGANEEDYLNETLTAISAQNLQRLQINAIGVLDVGHIQEKFLKSLASMNGGTYTRIQR